MALVKEGGTIVAGANTYVTLAEADAYHESLGNTTWVDGDDDLKEVALLKATQQMEARYRTRWHGAKRADHATITQRLSWPRKAVVDEDGIEIDDQTIPYQVLDAQCEIALIIFGGGSFVAGTLSATESSITSESVGPISTSYGSGKGGSQDTFPFIDQMLETLANTAGGKVSMTIGLTAYEIEELADTGFDPADYPEFFITG